MKSDEQKIRRATWHGLALTLAGKDISSQILHRFDKVHSYSQVLESSSK